MNKKEFFQNERNNNIVLIRQKELEMQKIQQDIQGLAAEINKIDGKLELLSELEQEE